MRIAGIHGNDGSDVRLGKVCRSLSRMGRELWGYGNSIGNSASALGWIQNTLSPQFRVSTPQSDSVSWHTRAS